MCDVLSITYYLTAWQINVELRLLKTTGIIDARFKPALFDLGSIRSN
jgi:hypothetical protein